MDWLREIKRYEKAVLANRAIAAVTA